MSPLVLITGGNAGIGLATAQQLAQRGARLVLACRNAARAEAARGRIQAAAPGAQVEVLPLDLASLESVRRLAATVAERHPQVDVLINNAGAVPLKPMTTAEGFEWQFGANYLGHVLLTHLLLPSLQAAAGQTGEARIVHVSSIAHNFGRIDPSTFRGGTKRPLAAYAQSKLGNLMFNFALARRLPASVTTQALHPGGVDSEIYRELPKAVYAVMRLFLISPERAGQLVTSLALDPQWKGRTGDYHSVQWPKPVSRTARDRRQQDELYETSCRLLGLTPLPLQG